MLKAAHAVRRCNETSLNRYVRQAKDYYIRVSIQQSYCLLVEAMRHIGIFDNDDLPPAASIVPSMPWAMVSVAAPPALPESRNISL